MKFGDPVRVAEERRIRLHSFYYGVIASWDGPGSRDPFSATLRGRGDAEVFSLSNGRRRSAVAKRRKFEEKGHQQ
jgi:hypothetical protein